MAKKSYVRTDAFLGKLDKADTVIKQEISDLTMEVAKFGAERMQHYISTRGRNREWERGWPSRKTGRLRYRSGPGRIDSGDMLRNVSVKFQRGQKQSRAVFGWVNKYEEYYKFQEREEGFVHWISGEKIPGITSLRDARRDTVNELPRLRKKYRARITRRLNK